MTAASPWVRPVVWIVALAVMALPLAGSSPESRHDGSRGAILELIGAQERAWNEGDLVGFLGAFAQGADVVVARGEDAAEGWSRILQRYRASFDEPDTMGHLTLRVRRVDLLGRDHARALGEWTLQGDCAEAGRGLFTLILERRQRGWRIIHDHTSRAARS
jgi:uncharacterized protein (TIGR02246 family)